MLIQHFYQAHRQSRNEQQIASILDPGFPGWRIDPILQKLVDPKQYPGYVDPRNCLVFWARPPQNICKLIGVLQDRLLKMSPSEAPNTPVLMLLNLSLFRSMVYAAQLSSYDCAGGYSFSN